MKYVNQFQIAADILIEQYQLSRNNHHSQWWIFQRHLF